MADNIFLGREMTRGGRLGWLDDRAMEDRTRRLFDRLGAPISPRARVGDLRIGDQQMVEIAKALAFEAAIVIMDEPTSALSDAEVARLFRVIDDLRQAGTTVLYISHKMNEVFTLADRVTVLRDGQFVASAPRAEIAPDQVVRWMVGREIAALNYEPHPIQPRAILEVEGLSLRQPRRAAAGPTSRDITFSVRAGEVVGVAGLLGAGRTELLEAIYGATPSPPAGTIVSRAGRSGSTIPTRRSAAGVAMVTEDRKTLGLFDRDDRRREHHDPPPARADLRRPAADRPPRRAPRRRVVDQGAGDQDGRRRCADHQPLGRQPAEVHHRPLAPGRAPGSCCSTSRPAASTSAPSRRSTS